MGRRSAVGARRGLLIKGGSALEIIGRVNTVAFDKTGTLTEGKPCVTDVVAFTQEQIIKDRMDSQGENAILALFASVESASSHPLAKAIIDHAKAANIVIPVASKAYATAGKAVHATVAERALAIASPVYAANETSITSKQSTQIEALQNEGKTVSVLFDEQSREVLGLPTLLIWLHYRAQRCPIFIKT